MPGAQLRYFVRSAESEPLAVLGFGAAEDRTASSWERRQPAFRRQQRKVTALGQNQTYPMSSHRSSDVCSTTAATLCVQHCLKPFAKASRELAAVQPTRVGKTQGRGKLDVKNEYALPVKDARPLRRDEGSADHHPGSERLRRMGDSCAVRNVLEYIQCLYAQNFFYSGTENCEFSTPRTRFLQIPPQGPPPGHHALRQTTAPGKKNLTGSPRMPTAKKTATLRGSHRTLFSWEVARPPAPGAGSRSAAGRGIAGAT